jgi:hypothetical protein
VIHDKTIALWNVIAGEGDAIKPSENTKVTFMGNLDSLRIKIKNGKRLAVDTLISLRSAPADYVIKNTGCEEVYINVTRHRKVVYKDTIPFHCGE